MNRKQRRTLEKQLGLAKQYKNSSESEKIKIRKRKREMGDKIHQQNIENTFNDQMAAVEKSQMDFIQKMINSGKSSEEARSILDNNIKIKEMRAYKLEEREQRRSKIK